MDTGYLHNLNYTSRIRQRLDNPIMTTENTQAQVPTPPIQTDHLTERQTEVLKVIREHLTHHGAPPTRAEIAKRLGFRSVNAAEDHLKALARKGAITLFPGTSRGIQLLGQHSLGLPIVVRKNPQVPLLHEENIESRCKVDPALFKITADFLLRAGGHFVQAGFLEGDLIAIQQRQQPENGQLVLARVNNELILKLYQRRADCIELLNNGPTNTNLPPLRFALGHEQAIQLEGIVVGFIRPGFK